MKMNVIFKVAGVKVSEESERSQHITSEICLYTKGLI